MLAIIATAPAVVTLDAIRACNPCASGWRKLIASLPAGATECTLAHIVESNGLDDALWALRALPLDDAKRIATAFAISCANRAKGYSAAHADAHAARAAYADAAATAAFAAARAAERKKQRKHFLSLAGGAA